VAAALVVKRDSLSREDYVFPSDPTMAVTSLEIETNGKKITGVLKKSADAAADYDDAISAGSGAALLEQVHVLCV